MPTPTTVAIALGSNLGDRDAHLSRAIGALRALHGFTPHRTSRALETAALTLPGSPSQPPYLNAAMTGAYSRSSRELLGELLAIERAAGRQRDREPRWGARVLDLDLLLFGDSVIDEPGLVIPHPRLHERLFVLAPLAEILPEARHPVLGLTIRELLERRRAASMSG